MSPRTNKTKPVPGIFYPEEQFKRMMVTLTLLVCIALSWYLYMDYGLRDFFFYIYYLPILAGAIYYGLKGGLIISGTVSILYAIVLVSFPEEREAFLDRDFLIKVISLNLVAFIVGKISGIGLRYRSQLFYLKEYNENIVESITEGIVTTDRWGKLTGVNKELEAHIDLSKSEILKRYFWEIFPPTEDFDWRANLSHLIETGSPTHNSNIRYRPPLVKEEVIINIRSHPLKNRENNIIGTVSLVEYVTKKAKLEEGLRKAYRELRATQEQLVQSGKMAAAGRLAGGVAHELNNPLGGILGFAQAALLDTKEDDQIYKDLKAIEEAALHCKEIVSGLLNFSRQTKGEFREVDVNKAIEATLALVNHQTKLQNIEIVKDLSSRLSKVTGNFNQLQQVFLNMVTNARDAMPEGGKLFITTRNIARGRKVEATFLDTGSGIPEEHMDKLFEPFFTTKEPGQGVGLGLSVSYGIIKDHGGEIEMRNRKGAGVEFRIILPARQITAR
ncbi:ATP-binding protein [bacterium]|nr:PAS domain S-box protein [bacterium]MCG2677683.1 ATP-binding protein [bacterium]